MGFQSVQTTYKPELFAPMWGLSAQEVADEALVLGLANRSSVQPITIVQDFTLDAPTGSGYYMYFASPVSLGLVQFYDVVSQFIGGWDGANNNPYEVYGPITINVTAPSGAIVPFYVYRTDYAELGSVRWTTSTQV